MDEKEATDPQPASSIWLHDFPDIPDELGERVPDLSVLDHERLGNAFCGSWSGGNAALEVSSVLASATHSKDELKHTGRRWYNRNAREKREKVSARRCGRPDRDLWPREQSQIEHDAPERDVSAA